MSENWCDQKQDYPFECILGPLKHVVDVTQENPSVVSEVFPHFLFPFGVYNIFFNSVRGYPVNVFFLVFLCCSIHSLICENCDSITISSFLLWSEKAYPVAFLLKPILLISTIGNTDMKLSFDIQIFFPHIFISKFKDLLMPQGYSC